MPVQPGKARCGDWMGFDDEPAPGNGEHQYDIFLAHSHADSEWVKDLAARLEVTEFEGRSLKVFIYEWDVEPGDNIVLTLQDGLVHSRHFAIVMTPEALTSKFTNLEWTTAIWNDPANTNGKVIPILRKPCDPPAFLSVFGYVDFRKDSMFEASFDTLVRRLRGQSQRRGPGINFPTGVVPSLAPEAHEPDAVDETLSTNLHPVLGLPPTVYHAATPCRTPRAVFDKIRIDRKARPSFILRQGRIYSFAPLNDSRNPLFRAIDGDRVTEEPILTVLTDPKRRGWVVHLLHEVLGDFLYTRQVYYDRDHKRYYFGVKGDEARREKWKSPARTSSRIVCRGVEVNGSVRRYEHLAAYMRFHDLGGELHLLVNPTWTFTRDGRQPLSQLEMTRQTVKKTFRQSNGVVINDCRFWMSYMADMKTELVIPAGAAGDKLAGAVRVSLVPLTVQLPRGITGDNTIPDHVSEPPSMSAEYDEEEIEA